MPGKATYATAHHAALAIVLGSVITVGLLTVSSMDLMEKEEDVYNVQISQVTDAIIRSLTVVDEVLNSMRVLFDASTFVDPDEFRIIAEDALSRHGFIRSAMYLPLVTDEERDNYVAAMHDEGYQDFDITELKNGRYVPASRRERYYPVIYQEPFEPRTAGVVGLDLLSQSQYAPYILQAIDTAESSAAMLEPADPEKGYVVFKAVYAGKVDSEQKGDRRALVNGIVALRIDADRLLAGYTIGHQMKIGLDMYSTVQGKRVFPVARYTGPDVGNEFGHWQFHSLSDEHDIWVGSQHFQLNLDKGLHLEDVGCWSVLGALSMGLIVTALLWLLARANRNRALDLEERNEEIQQLVMTRTQELAQEKERAQITLKSIGDAVITTDHNANIEYMNVIAEELTGWDMETAKGRPVVEVFRIRDEETEQEASSLVLLCLEQRRAVKRQENSVLINNNGDSFAIDESAAPICDTAGMVVGVVLVFHDVGQARSLAQKMAYQATHDALTGLANRALLMDRLKQECHRVPWSGRIVAVMFLDLDRFKMVNDSLGHDAGDQLIEKVARRLEGCLRDGDTVGRLGGDEFVIVLTDVAHHDDIRA
jgi:PAS domain S-box-containing protein